MVWYIYMYLSSVVKCEKKKILLFSRQLDSHKYSVRTSTASSTVYDPSKHAHLKFERTRRTARRNSYLARNSSASSYRS